MNARELRDKIDEDTIRGCSFTEDEENTILRALDLLASVEESGDEIVLRLRACGECEQAPLGPLLSEAAALERIAALEAENAMIKAALQTSQNKLKASGRYKLREENARLRKAFLYNECGAHADDNPGLRGECAEKKRAGKPCPQCPDAYCADRGGK